MIVDAETLDLTNSIEGLLDDLEAHRRRGRGQARADGVGLRDRHDAVPRHRPRRAASCARCAATVQAGGRRARAGDRRGRHPPVRDVGGPADRLAPALPRPDRRPAVRRPPGADLRHPRARGPRRPRQGRSTWPTGCACTCRCCWRCRPTRRSGAPTHTGLLSTRTPIFRAFPRVGIPPRYDDFDDWSRRIEFMIASQGDRGLHLPLVRRAPAPEVRHRRDAGDGLADPRWSTRSALAALVQAMVKELAEHFDARRAALALPVRDARREQVAGRPARPRGRAGGPARAATGCAPRELARRLLDRLRGARGGPGLGRRAGRHRGPARATATAARRQLVVYEANHDLREVVGEIVEATVPAPAETRASSSPLAGYSRSGEPARPLRRLQELRVRGQPVRDRVPVLRAAGAQAGAQARPRRRGRAARPSSAAGAPRLSRLRPDEIRGSRRTPGPYGDDRADRGLAAGDARAGHAASSTLVEVGGIVVRLDDDEPWRCVTAPVRARQPRLPVRRARGRRACSARCSSAASAGSR